MHKAKVWHPLRSNPLDHLDRKDLVTPKGEEVRIEKAMGGGNFYVTVGSRRFMTGGNISTCSFLNRREVGTQERN
jgi:hypothetical protein